MIQTVFLSDRQRQMAALAARLLREGGLELHEARRAAALQLNFHQRGDEPSLEAILQEVHTQLRLFQSNHAEILLALRQLAAQWMQDLAAFTPLLRGAVWLGVATPYSGIYLDLYAEASKDVEIALLNAGLDYETPDAGERQDAPLLRCYGRSPALAQAVPIYLQVHSREKLRGALKTPLEPGSSLRLRGDAAALVAIITA
jgi:hypothetical protein